jgi:BCD family chlorophyll transporter-like MFS transporter
MNRIEQKLVSMWASLGPRFLPFANVATPDLPLGRLLRLSLFQVSVGMALVLLVGTLNRVMIVELGVPASLVGIMLALPVLAAPFRAMIGHRSDTHHCELGWRRVPFIWKGTLLQFGGFAFMPFALLVLAGKGQSAGMPAYVGQLSAGLAFLLVGAGVHTVQTAGLALATDLSPPDRQPRVVGLMYVMLLLGMMGSALAFGAALEEFSPGRLIQVIQAAAVITVALNLVALWKQESRNPPRGARVAADDPSFMEAWRSFCDGTDAIRRLVIVGLGTMAFGMADILLEPFGGEVLGMPVSATTKLTALLALGGLLGFAYASHALGNGRANNAYRLAQTGSLIGLPSFVLVIAAIPADMLTLFIAGNFGIGFGAALFGHGTLTATMNRAPRDQVGLALGSWGAVQATAAGVGVALSGTMRDLVQLATGSNEGFMGLPAAANGYLVVYAFEITLLVITIVASLPLIRQAARNLKSDGRDFVPAPALAIPSSESGKPQKA